jgi:uncharacterized protein (UPF0261 family)
VISEAWKERLHVARRILIIGTFDTKGAEAGFLKEQIEQRGHRTVLMDIGTRGEADLPAHIPRREIVRASGMVLQEALDAGNRQKAVDVMIEGGRRKARELYDCGDLDGIIALGGGTALFMGTAIMQAIPIGVPKLMLSSMIAGDMSRFVDGKDITLMQSVADIVGLNPLTSAILTRAAGAICGMVEAEADEALGRSSHGKSKASPLIAVTDFGITTECALHASQLLKEQGCEAVIFHAVGSGGTAMEELLARDLFSGVLDLTTHELMDHLAGGFYGDIGPERLITAGQRGIPIVVGPGGLDCISVIQEAIPARFQGRKFYYHDFRRCARPNVEELTHVARVMAERLNLARGPVKVLLPLRGWSEPGREGEPLYNPKGTLAFGEELRKLLKFDIEVIELDAHLNDPLYAEAAVALLQKMMGRD